MTDHTDYQSSEPKSSTTIPSIGSSLLAEGRIETELGHRYLIKPLAKSVILAPLPNRETKDLVHCLTYIPRNQNYVFLNTAINHPMIYHRKENESLDEGLERLVLKPGEPIGVIIQILD